MSFDLKNKLVVLHVGKVRVEWMDEQKTKSSPVTWRPDGKDSGWMDFRVYSGRQSECRKHWFCHFLIIFFFTSQMMITIVMILIIVLQLHFNQKYCQDISWHQSTGLLHPEVKHKNTFWTPIETSHFRFPGNTSTQKQTDVWIFTLTFFLPTDFVRWIGDMLS